MNEANELVLGLGFEENTPGHWAFFGDENEVVRTITDLSTTNAELRREVERYKQALEAIEAGADIQQQMGVATTHVEVMGRIAHKALALAPEVKS
jgi:nicotinate-nucleotide pyrophosphorylase